ncbi:NADH-quinone oxidoreductase subunit A [Desulfitispora alkaliphila]|uniref:NADH-quinone oxidoreductase subunit A n=1 Tax=Desulfitispora alkaliphila TaxID=622674 RepID=UPI003D1B17DA
MSEYGTIGIFVLIALSFPIITMLVNRILRPHNPTEEKLTTYECGLDTQGQTWVQFRTSYFLYALAYLLFGVEAIFLYPWALKFLELGLVAHSMMAIFILVLVIGLIYDWKEGALEWDK